MTLEDDIAAAFSRACRERDLELAEFLFQALEAIAEREGSEERVETAFGVLLHILPAGDTH
jgi:hypothetical protein